MKFKFAVVKGQRREAEPGLSGKCDYCQQEMVAKCGQLRVWHWSHRGACTCDTWWEPETEWHRAWKDHFPKAWQEIIHQPKDGERHKADVKTDNGLILEFQHSFLRREEREAREMFYQKMVWVVNGVRLKRDRAQFFASVDAAEIVNREPLIVSLRWKEGALLRDWGASRVPVYFDFGDLSQPGDTLWRLNLYIPNGMRYLSRVPKTEFLNAHLKGLPFEEMCSEIVERAHSLRAARVRQQVLQSQGLTDFQRYLARQERRRRRF